MTILGVVLRKLKKNPYKSLHKNPKTFEIIKNSKRIFENTVKLSFFVVVFVCFHVMGTLMSTYSSEFSLFTVLITQYKSSLFYNVQTKINFENVLAEGLLVFNLGCEYRTTGRGSKIAGNWNGMKTSYIYFTV